MNIYPETIKEFEDSIREFEHEDNTTIIISLGGASIVGDGWDLSMKSDDFDAIINKHGYDVDKIREAVIELYNNFKS